MLIQRYLVSLAAIGLCLAARAGDESLKRAEVATNLSGVTAFLPLPKDFNSDKASNAELQEYGLPPRPNKDDLPILYKMWQSRVEAAKHRVIPNLLITAIKHRPINIVQQLHTRVDGGVTASNNWSGYAITGSNGQFAKWGSEITGSFVEPSPGCDSSQSGDKNMSTWVGIDGYGSPDVLQTGTEIDLNCAAPYAAPTNVEHFAWYEWFPAYAIKITNVAVRPGDKIDVAVFLSDGKHHFVSFENASTKQTFTLNMTPPNGTSLQGNSVEWVVERPEINNVLTNLAQFGALSMQSIYVWYPSATGTPQGNYPGNAPSGTIFSINMMLGDQVLSAPSLSPIDNSIALFSTPVN